MTLAVPGVAPGRSVGGDEPDTLVVGRWVWTGATTGPGAVFVRNGTIAWCMLGTTDVRDLVGPGTRIVDAGDGLVMPGIHDNHTFLTAALLDHGSIDGRGLGDEAVLGLLAETVREHPARTVLAGNLAGSADRGTRLTAELARRVPEAKAALLGDARAWLATTPRAGRELGECDPRSNESLAPLYAALARDERLVRDAMIATTRFFAAHGVTSLKDIAFDDYLGMLPVLGRLHDAGELPVRMAFAIQPVRAAADLSLADELRRRREGPRFHGFKLMTDGAFDEGTASLLDGDGLHGSDDVDWDGVERQARRILDAGHRLALNADGDGAVRRSVHILERYVRNGGRLPDGSGLSDVSLIHEEDIPRVAALDLVVETYPHLVRQDGFDRALLERLLDGRGHRLGPFRSLVRAGVRLTAGTDFPLFAPDVPQSILSASERLLPAVPDAEPDRWFPENGMSREEVLRSWTSRPGAAMGAPFGAGAFLAGAPGDIAVFDRNLLTATPDELAEACVVLTLQAGRVTHAR
jgi:predicted amidohydrolase YtcJ